MRRLGSVQQKMPCVFVTEVKEEPSRKRDCQQFQVVATENVNPRALKSNIHCALATEKLDGTCCYVSIYKVGYSNVCCGQSNSLREKFHPEAEAKGEPYLWARLDRKPNKQADKRFKKFHHSRKSCKEFTWNVEEDFRNIPDSWIPAHGVQHQNGQPVPDENGHIPGWVPVEKNNKQYCWHSSVVNYDAGIALVLRPSSDGSEFLEVAVVPLSELLEQTLELIGTNINANPYGLGSKKRPIHLLVPHGILQIQNAPSVNYQQLVEWFRDCAEGNVEGIVWHCNDGTLVKLHRHHLGLKWPDGDTFLHKRPVIIRINWVTYVLDVGSEDLFGSFANLNGCRFDCIQDVHFET